MRKRSSGFPTESDTNRAVLSQKMSRGLKFRIDEIEGLYYLCSENKGADQLRGHHLRLCFRIYNNPVFSQRGSISPKCSSLCYLLTASRNLKRLCTVSTLCTWSHIATLMQTVVAEWVRSLNFSSLNHLIISPL